jgi:hypothetical protein
MDLKKLNDDELELLERLLEKAAGKLVGDVVPPFESSSSMLPSRPLMQTMLSDEFDRDPKSVIVDFVDPYRPGRDCACCNAKFERSEYGGD